MLRRVDSTATEDGQAASPSALADRKGIWQSPLDYPTRKRRKRRAPLACAAATLNKYSPQEREKIAPLQCELRPRLFHELRSPESRRIYFNSARTFLASSMNLGLALSSTAWRKACLLSP